jgi:hypothetical protein
VSFGAVDDVVNRVQRPPSLLHHLRRGGFAAYDIRTGDLTAVLGAEGSGQPARGQGNPAVLQPSPRGTILVGWRLRGSLSLLARSLPSHRLGRPPETGPIPLAGQWQ